MSQERELSTLDVYLHRRKVAELERQIVPGRAELHLTYTPNNPQQLSVGLPTGQQLDPKRIENWLWGLLPDNPDVIRRWANQAGVTEKNVFGILADVGADCAGAIQFVEPARTIDLEQGGVHWLTEAQINSVVADLADGPTSWHSRLPKNITHPEQAGMFSLAGAQSKTAVRYDAQHGRWGIPWGGAPTTHIIKPRSNEFVFHQVNEHLCLQTASNLGIASAQTNIHDFDGNLALVVKRYDRTETDDPARVHQEDFCQALGLSPNNKYQHDGGPSISDLADTIRTFVPPSRRQVDLERLADMFIYQWLLVAPDAHSKNYSLLHHPEQNAVRLAPLYDVASWLPYWDRNRDRKMKLAMKYGSDYAIRHRKSVWDGVASDLQLELDYVIDRLQDLARRIPDAFSDAVTQLRLEHLITDELDQWINSFSTEVAGQAEQSTAWLS